MKTDKIHNAKIIETKIVTFGVIEISIKVEDVFNFVAGQYIWLEIPYLTSPDPRGNRRAFSICNSPNNDNLLKIIFRTGMSGFKQSLASLGVGDKVLVHGPFGISFTLDENTPQNLILIAGGTGIAPFLSIIADVWSSRYRNWLLRYL